MRLGLYLPPGSGPFPVLTYLSGLTSTHENVIIKSGFQGWAAKAGLAVVTPDTSPRGQALDGTDIPDHPEWFIGQGAGFYVDATEAPWAPYFSMERYICNDVPALLAQGFADQIDCRRMGMTGHSMGGHGALTLAMRHPDQFQSLSAFAPIAAPSITEWGRLQFSHYLGDDEAIWRDHDACHLLQTRGWKGDLLVDQGEQDEFLETHLRPDLLQQAAVSAGIQLDLRMQPGYGHSYYFVASFIEDHIRWHRTRLG